jgi:putative FmdB family regulatory protein
MPFYDFRCKECDHLFTVRASIKEKEAGLYPECPVCHQPETQQVITAGVLIGQAAGNGRRQPTGSFCNPLAGPGCCG